MGKMSKSKRRPIIDFRYIALCQNQSALKTTGIKKIEAKSYTLKIKIRGN